MTPKQKRQIQQEIRQMHKTVAQATAALTQRVRAEVVIPFCDAQRLWFVSGMGGFSFYPLAQDPRWSSLSSWDRRQPLADEDGYLVNPSSRRPLRGSATVLLLLTEPLPGCDEGVGILLDDYEPGGKGASRPSTTHRSPSAQG